MPDKIAKEEKAKQKPLKTVEKKNWTDEKLRSYSTITAEEYIDERFNPMRGWYDKKATNTKNLYLRMRAASVVGGAIVPVLINVHIGKIGDLFIDILTSAISLVVVVFVSLESVFHYRERWNNYRSTEQLLSNEYFKFVSGEGPYSKLENREALLTFINRVEGIIQRENSSTLNVMTTVTEQKPEQSTEHAPVTNK
jgi:hypothetical protein